MEFSVTPISVTHTEGLPIYQFNIGSGNIDHKTVESFGEEWTKFDSFSEEDLGASGDEYFDIINLSELRNATVLEVGCGTGRWIKYLSGHASRIVGIDPSDAVFTASKMLKDATNITICRAEVDAIPFDDNFFDFVYSLGVLHHIPDTKSAMKRCIEKLKPGGRFLVYLYYSLDNKSSLYRMIFQITNQVRLVVSKTRPGTKKFICDLLAVILYMPFVLTAKFFKLIGLDAIAKHIPLSYYRNKSFNIIRNDSLDRFGTPLEQRFSKKEIQTMMEDCGLNSIHFSAYKPYWHAVGTKSISSTN